MSHNLTKGQSIWIVQAKERDSWTWKCLLSIRDELKNRLGCDNFGVILISSICDEQEEFKNAAWCIM